MQLDEKLLSQETALELLIDAGKRAGIGSFRVCKSGHYGQFQVTKWEVLDND
jgi:hypothetical protein